MKKYLLFAVALALLAGRAGAADAPPPNAQRPMLKGGIYMRRISAINTATQEITVGSATINIPAADIARLKVGDRVAVSLVKGEAHVSSDARQVTPAAFQPSAGMVVGRIDAINAVTSEITIHDKIVKLAPATLSGLSVGDEVTVEITDGLGAITVR